jgi:hypothetical protein
MKKFFLLWIFIFALAAPLLHSQTVELACPAGYSVMPTVGTTQNLATGGIKQWLCVDVFGNVSAQSSSPGQVTATAGFFSNTPQTPPTGTIDTTGCSSQTGGTRNPLFWIQNASGHWNEWFCVDTTISGPPTAPAGTPEFVWRTWFNSSGAAMPAGKSRFVSIYHVPGMGGTDSGSGTLDTSALSTFLHNTGTEQTFHQFITNYSEAVISGTPTWTGHAGGEVSASVYRGNLTFQGTNWTGGSRFYTYSAQMEHNDASVPGGGSGTYQSYISSSGGSGNFAGNRWSGLNCESSAGSGTETNTIYACVRVNAPTTRFANNYGIQVSNFGTNPADFDYVGDGVNSAGIAAGFNYFVGPTALGFAAHAATGYQLDITGAVKVKAAAGVRQLDLFGSTSGSCGISNTCPFNSTAYQTASNCSSTGGTCGSASAGSVSIAAGATTVTVSTTAVTANSQIFIQEDSSLGTKLSVTCNTTITRTYTVTARTAGTSFVITASAAPATNPACLSYNIIN